MEDLLLYLILIVLSIVQSIFGVGILLFGTPTLIYLDYSFINTLNVSAYFSMTDDIAAAKSC